MRRLFQSGAAFLIVAASCFVAGVLILVLGLEADNGSLGIAITFMSAGGVWFIIAIAVRSKNSARHKSGVKLKK